MKGAGASGRAPANAALARLKRNFATVRHAKPPASRAESAEVYVVAMGRKG